MHSKILLAGIISGIVAITTSVLGVTGTVIGSVIASIIYNFLSEFLEKSIKKADINKFENELIYVFPLVIIVIIQFLLILAFLSEWGFLPDDFLDVYLFLQGLVSNNLYRILGISTLVISIYPMFLKTTKIKRNDGILLAFAGLIFLFKGFVDLDNPIVDLYKGLYSVLDFYLAILAFLILIYLILKLTFEAYNSNTNSQKINMEDLGDLKLKKVKYEEGFNQKSSNSENNSHKLNKPKIKNKKDPKIKNKKDDVNINSSAEDIEFVSNNLLNNKKK
ncbi:MAG: hypothetical protein KO202_07880 [Methanobacteriaceae archaeon]|nr:hypothetical protein [Methanobacteriaceae archaeon]